MATRFWKGGGSSNTWAATGNTNWAATSGGTNNQSVPGTGDIAVFDSNSGTSNSVIGANITVQGLECDGSTLGTGAYAGTLTQNTGVTLTLNTGAANTLRLASGMAYTPADSTSIVAFTHTTGTANIKSYGKAFGAITINGVGGTTQLLDDINITVGTSAILTLTNGAFDANGGAGGPFAITTTLLSSNNGNVRTLTLGGTVTLGGKMSSMNSVWNTANVTNLTFNKNSANIVIVPPTTPTVNNAGVTFQTGGLTFNDLTLNATSINLELLLTNPTTIGTFSHFYVNPGWSINLTSQATLTVTNAFTWAGTATQPINLLAVLAAGGVSQATISCASGACSLNWGTISGIAAVGGATFAATNALNGAANSGWTISPPDDSTLHLTAAEITTLGKMIDGVACGTVTTGASTTSVPTSALAFGTTAATGVVADEFKGRVIEFSGSTTTAGLRGATSAISANTASNTPTFTVAALPATPVSGDVFCII